MFVLGGMLCGFLPAYVNNSLCAERRTFENLTDLVKNNFDAKEEQFAYPKFSVLIIKAAITSHNPIIEIIPRPAESLKFKRFRQRR